MVNKLGGEPNEKRRGKSRRRKKQKKLRDAKRITVAVISKNENDCRQQQRTAETASSV